MSGTQTGTINIRRDVSDKFYRYKMPKLLAKVEGKGNGIKTVIPNMSDIAKSLARPPTYTTKYFGIELGAQVKTDDKNDRYIVNGSHEAEKLAKLLDGFIEKFVLCGSCKNPETDFVIAKDDTISKSCKACGAITSVDNRHKLCTFILKNPPSNAKKSKKDKKDKKSKKSDHNGSSSALPSDEERGSDNEGGDDADEIARMMEREVAALKLTKEEALAADKEGDDDDWAVDTSEAAVNARLKELAVGGALSKIEGEYGDDDDEDDESPLAKLEELIQEKGSSINDKEILEFIENNGIRKDKACTIIVQSIFTKDILTKKEVPQRSTILRILVQGSDKSEKAQKAILGGLERILGVLYSEELLNKSPLVLKEFYDNDIVEEEIIIAWSEKASKKYVDKKISKTIREKVDPFIQWLKEASEDDDDDDEDDDEEEEEEELDIDDI